MLFYPQPCIGHMGGKSSVVDMILVAVILLIILFFVLSVLGDRERRRRNEEIRKRVLGGTFLSADQFESDRAYSGLGDLSDPDSDVSGCYVILIFEAPVMDGNYDGYWHGYIGQSIHVVSRVHSHLTGSGNGDVYADRKYGKHVYVRIVTCPVAELNSLEVRLIAAFDWDRLYNKSRGGGVQHTGVPDEDYSGGFRCHRSDSAMLLVEVSSRCR